MVWRTREGIKICVLCFCMEGQAPWGGSESEWSDVSQNTKLKGSWKSYRGKSADSNKAKDGLALTWVKKNRPHWFGLKG